MQDPTSYVREKRIWTPRQKRRHSIALIACILAAAAALMGIYLFRIIRMRQPRLRITVGNEVYGTYSLTEDRTIRINDTNVCEIRDGTVRMTEADCPDQICVHMIPIDRKGGSIVCLPNEVVLTIVDADNNKETDTLAG